MAFDKNPFNVELDEPIKMVPTRSDHDIARELKTELLAVSGPICDVLNKALSQGFQINIIWGMNAFGKMHVAQCVISKQFVD